jgi:hypothetical protein
MAKIIASWTKQILLVFFDDQGMGYTGCVSRRITFNADHILGAMHKFLKALQQKRPHLVTKESFLHWDKMPVHTAQLVQAFLAKNSSSYPTPPPPNSPVLAPADFSLFLTLKKELAGMTMTTQYLLEVAGVMQKMHSNR